jgi:hypothetical protein
MIRIALAILTLTLAASLVGCAAAPTAPAMTPLEIQAMQTRDYEDGAEVVFRSVVSVFQDLGYTIRSADQVTGFIQADGNADRNEALRFWIGSTRTTQTSATAFVERIGSMTRIRINFVTSVEESSVYGASDREEQPILEAQIYQNAFERVENAIFVRNAAT